MQIEEQIKAINKQISFLEKYKDKFTQGKQDKISELNYTVECLNGAVSVLSNITSVKDSLVKITQQLIT